MKPRSEAKAEKRVRRAKRYRRKVNLRARPAPEPVIVNVGLYTMTREPFGQRSGSVNFRPGRSSAPSRWVALYGRPHQSESEHQALVTEALSS